MSDAQKLMFRENAAEFEERERSAEEQRAAQASEPPSDDKERDEYLLQQLEYSANDSYGIHGPNARAMHEMMADLWAAEQRGRNEGSTKWSAAAAPRNVTLSCALKPSTSTLPTSMHKRHLLSLLLLAHLRQEWHALLGLADKDSKIVKRMVQ